MSGEDVFYFQSRAEAELKLAQDAQHPNAVKAHYLLANSYLDRIHGALPTSDATTSAEAE